MQKVVFIFITVLLLACTAISSYFKRKNKVAAFEIRITITGSTRNIRGHAAVVSENACVYYVDGLNEWEQDWLNQAVKITGDLEIGDDGIAGKIIKAAIVMRLHKEAV
jgi:hypothetical protein